VKEVKPVSTYFQRQVDYFTGRRRNSNQPKNVSLKLDTRGRGQQNRTTMGSRQNSLERDTFERSREEPRLPTSQRFRQLTGGSSKVRVTRASGKKQSKDPSYQQKTVSFMAKHLD